MHAVNDDYTIFTNIGFTVHQEGSDSNPFTCKAYLLSFVSDLPAKAAVLNFIQFNVVVNASNKVIIHNLNLGMNYANVNY